mmetsp:Transcript_19777/g.28450  ORF Transcript_19777/g.28450 Transcript_19777/m.28450 type:complete len:325 (+) Transcript_19777:99-1073(+)
MCQLLFVFQCIVMITCSTYYTAVCGYSAHEFAHARQSNERLCLHTDMKHTNRSPRDTLLHNNCSVYYIHNHKTGGTTMCKSAQENGFRTLPNNCNFRNVYGNFKSNIRDMRRMNANFGSLEFNSFMPILSYEKILYIMTVRDPIERLFSTFHHNFKSKNSNKRHIYEKQVTQANCGETLPHVSFEDFVMNPCFERLSALNNYYLNMLTGCGLKCDKRNVQQAVDKLELISVIIVLDENLDRYMRYMEYKLGMCYSAQHRSGSHHSADISYRSSNETVKERLYKINALDIKFYNLLVVHAERQLTENKEYARFSKIYCPKNHKGT